VATEDGITRADQDAFALRSHQNAVRAQETGAFTDELAPVEIPEKKGPPTVVDRDEGPRGDTSLEALGKLSAAFRKGGTVTAGNSSTLNDGAAALLVMSEDKAKALGLTPMARWVASASAGVSPRTMGVGPVPATQKALARAGWSLADVDLMELNEAFAAQSLACVRRLGFTEEAARARVNVNGGAIALGHPLGMSGARILISLMFEMRRRGVARGAASLCVGVGQGVTTLIQRVE
jgi:acetyl-CoA acetyltransferase family protein